MDSVLVLTMHEIRYHWTLSHQQSKNNNPMCIQFPYILEDNYQRKRDKKTYIGS